MSCDNRHNEHHAGNAFHGNLHIQYVAGLSGTAKVDGTGRYTHVSSRVALPLQYNLARPDGWTRHCVAAFTTVYGVRTYFTWYCRPVQATVIVYHSAHRNAILLKAEEVMTAVS